MANTPVATVGHRTAPKAASQVHRPAPSEAADPTGRSAAPVESTHLRKGRLVSFFQRDEAQIVAVIGRIASVLSVIMYVSYITQISNNLAGHPGTPWQPLAAFFNCVMWTAYGVLKPKKDWPIIVANVPGIFLAAITFVTSLI